MLANVSDKESKTAATAFLHTPLPLRQNQTLPYMNHEFNQILGIADTQNIRIILYGTYTNNHLCINVATNMKHIIAAFK